MATLTDSPEWTDNEVILLEASDEIEGAGTGASYGGIGRDNQPHQQLANRTAWLKENLGFSNQQIFTVSGSFVVPDDITEVYVQIVGGGGGGAPCSRSIPGGGGGAGGYWEGLITGLTPGQTIAVSVGAGGHGLAAGLTGQAGQGGTSSFGTYASATGGQGGGNVVGAWSGGSPGAGSPSGFAGGWGEDATVLAQSGVYTSLKAGNGGASYFGGGGHGGSLQTPGAYGDGTAPGSGGGGTYLEGATSSQPQSGNNRGGNGAPGLVIVWWRAS
jgi:hypothetical protein